MICQWVGLALELLHDPLALRLSVMGNMPEVPLQAEVPAKGILDQICKVGITNHGSDVAYWNLKGFGINLLSCGYQCWPQEQGGGR